MHPEQLSITSLVYVPNNPNSRNEEALAFSQDEMSISQFLFYM